MTKRLILEWLAALWIGLMPVLLPGGSLSSSRDQASSLSTVVDAAPVATHRPSAGLDPVGRLPEPRLVDAAPRAVTRQLLDGAAPLSSWLSPSSWTLTPPSAVMSSVGLAVGPPAVRHGIERWRTRGLPARAGPVFA